MLVGYYRRSGALWMFFDSLAIVLYAGCRFSEICSVFPRIFFVLSHRNNGETWGLYPQTSFTAMAPYPNLGHQMFTLFFTTYVCLVLILDHVFDQTSTNSGVFEAIAKPIVQSTLAGFHGELKLCTHLTPGPPASMDIQGVASVSW